MKKLIIIIYLSIFSFYSGLTAQAGDSTLVLQDLIHEMLENNPELESQYHIWQSSMAQISQAGSLPDPELGLGIMNLPVDNFSFNQDPMTGKQISLMQKFPFPGKLGRRQKIAEKESEKQQLFYIGTRNRLIKELKYIYFDLFFIDKALETNRKNQTLLKQVFHIADTRYRVGKGLQQDVLRSQLEMIKLTDRQLGLEQERTTIESRLNFLLNRPIQTPVKKVPDLSPFYLESTLTQIDSLAILHNPILLSWKAILAQSQQKLSLAKKEYLPDFSLEFTYTQREILQNGTAGADLISGMMHVSLPLYFWRKQGKMVEENKLNEMAVQERYKSVGHLIRQQLTKIFTEMEKNHKRLDLYDTGIIPQGKQALQSALSAYQVDKLEFISVIDNQMRLFDYELEYFRLVSNYQKNLAELEELIGREITEFDS